MVLQLPVIPGLDVPAAAEHALAGPAELLVPRPLQTSTGPDRMTCKSQRDFSHGYKLHTTRHRRLCRCLVPPKASEEGACGSLLRLPLQCLQCGFVAVKRAAARPQREPQRGSKLQPQTPARVPCDCKTTHTNSPFVFAKDQVQMYEHDTMANIQVSIRLEPERHVEHALVRTDAKTHMSI